jgi:hypothetical protein
MRTACLVSLVVALAAWAAKARAAEVRAYGPIRG